jgi:hypothetical protein
MDDEFTSVPGHFPFVYRNVVSLSSLRNFQRVPISAIGEFSRRKIQCPRPCLAPAKARSPTHRWFVHLRGAIF